MQNPIVKTIISNDKQGKAELREMVLNIYPLDDTSKLVKDLINLKDKYDDQCEKVKLKFETMKGFVEIYFNDSSNSKIELS